MTRECVSKVYVVCVCICFYPSLIPTMRVSKQVTNFKHYLVDFPHGQFYFCAMKIKINTYPYTCIFATYWKLEVTLCNIFVIHPILLHTFFFCLYHNSQYVIQRKHVFAHVQRWVNKSLQSTISSRPRAEPF